MGDRLGRRRPRRDRAEPRHRRRLRGVRRRSPGPRHGGRARPRTAVLARPPLGHRAPRLVRPPRRRVDRVRREPAEEVPGHLPAVLRRRPRGHPRRGAADRAALGRARREDLPGRQPAHQAARVLGAAARRGQGAGPRRAVPRRGVHPAADDARAGQDRLHAVVHVLHLADLVGGPPRVPHRPDDEPDRRLHARQPLAEHARHPPVPPAGAGAAAVQDPRDPGRDALPQLRHLLRVRAVRVGAAGAGPRGVPRLREVPAAAARLAARRGDRADARPLPGPAQRRTSGAACAAAPPRPALPRQRRPQHRGLQPAAPGRARPRGDRGGLARPARPSRDDRPARPRRARLARRDPDDRHRPARRWRPLHLGRDAYVRLDPSWEPAHLFVAQRLV